MTKVGVSFGGPGKFDAIAGGITTGDAEVLRGKIARGSAGDFRRGARCAMRRGYPRMESTKAYVVLSLKKENSAKQANMASDTKR